jgi:Family of unknown function (DUF6185)
VIDRLFQGGPMGVNDSRSPEASSPRVRPAVGTTWTFWVAVASLIVAIAAGWARQPPNDAVLLEPTGDDCPHSEHLSTIMTTTVSATDRVRVVTDLRITMTGATPANPLIDENLRRPDIPNDFATCFIPNSAKIKSASWSDGTIDAVFELAPDDEIVSLQLSPDHSSVSVDPCKPLEDLWIPALCNGNSSNTIVVRAQKPISTLLAVPFPTRTEAGDGYVRTSWRFTGSMPPVTLDLDVPFDVMATTWVDSPHGRNFSGPLAGSGITVNLQYVFSAVAFWLAIAVTAWLLRRTEPDVGWWSRINHRILLLGAAGVLLGFEVSDLGNLTPNIALGFVNVEVWAILSFAVAPRKWLPPVTTAAIAAWAILLYLAVTTTEQSTLRVLLLVYCALLLGLVGAGASALWRQIRTIFSLTHVDDTVTSWQRLYGTVVQCLVVGAFMIAVGFPVGTVLNRGGYRYDMAESLALNLTWSTGILFRAALAWTTLLVLVSFLVSYAVSHPSPGYRRVMPAVMATMLSLAAPWTDRISVAVVLGLPVWMLQAGILYVAFNRLIKARATTPAAPARRARNSHLLKEATQQLDHASRGNEEAQQSGPRAASSTETAPPPRPPAAVRRAQKRILALGPQRNRLENARSAAQVAGILAIVPVVYLSWTTIGTLGNRLTDNTGMLIVALFAVLELVRWVVAGFVFGYFYTDLPGRIGPVKALTLSAIYIASCTAPLMFAQAVGHDFRHEAVYRGAQFALFAIVLAVVYDLWSVRLLGGDWQELQRIYDLQSYGRVTAAVAPAALLVLTLAKQIDAGSGFDVADSLLSGITNVLKMGPL